MSGFLFLLVIDWIMKHSIQGNTGIRWQMMTKLEDLDFADDQALISSSQKHMQEKTSNLNNHKKIGLQINKKKTKLLKMNAKNQQPVILEGEEIESVQNFTYLGATVSNQGGCDEDIKATLS